MIVNVTQEMIDNVPEARKRCESCPIAQAINAVIDRNKYYTTVGTYAYYIYSYVSGEVFTRPLPPEAVEFITRYDVDPTSVGSITLNLEIPDVCLRTVVISLT
jgi:hypothetical protein